MNEIAGRVSVIVPVYGVERYVGAAIESALRQSWPDFELIVVDDCSRDGSWQVIQGFSDPRIKAIRLPENRGVAAARNAGMAAASGEFIAFLDGDDVMYPRRLERQVAFLRQRPGIALCGASPRTVGPHVDSPPRAIKIRIDPRAVNASLVFGNLFCTSSIMMRRQAVPAEGFRQRYAEDYDFLVRVAARHRLAIDEEILVDYRLRPDSAMQTCATEKKKQDVWESQLPLFEALNVFPSEQEREIHLFARNNAGRVDAERLIAIHRWYRRLVRANRRMRVYDDEEFQLAASHMWFDQLYRATGCGMKALRMFFGEPLSFAHPQPLILQAKFIAKALVGREFGGSTAPA